MDMETAIIPSCTKRYISPVFTFDGKKQNNEVKEHLGCTKEDLLDKIDINTKSKYQQKMNLKFETIKFENEEENENEKNEMKNILSELINNEDDLACCYCSSDDLYYNGNKNNELNLWSAKRKMKSDNNKDSSSPSKKSPNR